MTPPPPPPPESGLLRADAARNRERLVQAALTQFSQHGLSVPLDEIAGEAGVGVATLYRHFPSREALAVAIVEDRLALIARETDAVMATGRAPMDALRALLTYSAERQTTDRVMVELWRTVGADVIADASLATGLRAATQRLLDAAQLDGSVHHDVTVDDVSRIFFALAGVIEAGHGGAWRRVLELHLRAITAPGPPLPEPA